VLAVAACGPGLRARTELFDRRPRDTGLARLLAARDPKSIEAVFADDLTSSGIRFTDPACQAMFSGFVHVIDHANFAHCLVGLNLRYDEQSKLLYDVALVSYGPGIQLELRFTNDPDNPKLTRIGFAGVRDDTRDSPPTISQHTLESLRTSGTPSVPDELEQRALDADLAARSASSRELFAWLRVCIDAEGQVSSVEPFMTTALPALASFVRTAATWRHRPFLVDGRPTPVCSLVHLGSRKSQGPFPMAFTESKTIGALAPAIEFRRAAGDRLLTPDDETKVAMTKAGGGVTDAGMFLTCIRNDGTVASIQMIHSTGLPTYDQSIMRSVRAWRFEPFVADDKPVSVCAYLGYLYSHR